MNRREICYHVAIQIRRIRDDQKVFVARNTVDSKCYLETFNSISKDGNETYRQFGNRLTFLFEYYVESRQVSNSYDRLMQLVIYDRIKSLLPSFLARHVLDFGI